MSEVLEGVRVDLVGVLDVVAKLLGYPEDCFSDGALMDPMILSTCDSRGLVGS